MGDKLVVKSVAWSVGQERIHSMTHCEWEKVEKKTRRKNKVKNGSGSLHNQGRFIRVDQGEKKGQWLIE